MKWDGRAAAAASNPSVLRKFALSHLFFCLLKEREGLWGGLITRIISPPLSPLERFASAFFFFFLNDSGWQAGVLRRSDRLSKQRVSPAGPRAGSTRAYIRRNAATDAFSRLTQIQSWVGVSNRHLSRITLPFAR